MTSIEALPLLGPGQLPAALRRAATSPRPVLLSCQTPSDETADFAGAVARGLGRRPRRLPCRYLYDARGSELFDRITERPEYYPTRTEAGILRRCAEFIADITGPVTLLEFGAGSARKTGHLLAAYRKLFGRFSYVPVDVSATALRAASEWITRQFPAARVVAVNSSYEDGFPLLREVAPTLGIFLGSTVGNLFPDEFDRFWRSVQRNLPRGGYFLLGVDLVKAAGVLDPAYNDAAGITAEFTRNLFVRMNRELGAGLDVARIEHVARYHEAREQMEIHARFTAPQRLRLAPLAREFSIASGERILVEISHKFRLSSLLPRLAVYGLDPRATYLDDRRWFAVVLLQRTASHCG